VGQVAVCSRQVVQAVSPESVFSAIGHVGIWLERLPISPEEITSVMQSGWKREFTGRDQGVLNSFNATSYISLDGNHSFINPKSELHCEQ
jgi:hypothetical protein